MENNVYIFFKSAKTDTYNDAMEVYIDGVKEGVLKAGKEFKIQLGNGLHTIEIYMMWYGKKRCYAKKEIDINKPETYITYAPSIIYTINGKIKEVTKDSYLKKRKNDKLYAILILILAMIIYFILK